MNKPSFGTLDLGLVSGNLAFSVNSLDHSAFTACTYALYNKQEGQLFYTNWNL